MKLFWSFWIIANVFFWIRMPFDVKGPLVWRFIVGMIPVSVTGLLPLLLWRAL